MASNQLSAEPLESVPRFNWLFLVELIVCGILAVFFLFYFNRLFATLVSYGIRAYTWHYYRVYIDIHALQISLLGGRIFFKGIRYHGENETILVHSGYVTWRYWLRSVKSPGLLDDNEATLYPSDSRSGERPRNADGGYDEPSANTSQPPCRLQITLQGLEWFIYNRSAAYDSILSGFPRPESDSGGGAERNKQDDEKTKSEEHPSSDANVREAADHAQNPSSSMPSEPLTDQQKRGSVMERFRKMQKEMLSSMGGSVSGKGDSSTNKDDVSLPRFLSSLPINIQCNKGAIVIGNENTKSILTATYGKASGEIDAKKTGPLDLYKQTFDFDFSHPIIQLKPNPDFKNSQLAAARATATSGPEASQQRRKFDLHWRYHRRKQKIWHSIRDLIPYFQTSVESFHPNSSNPRASQSTYRGISDLPDGARWAGLTRYRDEEDQNDHEGWNSVEYGRFSTILDCPHLRASYHWDIPGNVTSDRRSSVQQVPQDVNGAEAPEWGLHLTVKGGNINYGPWADRERACFQSILFPNTYRDSHPSAALAPGAPRECTKFRLTVDIQDDMTLRVPTREQSKDWLWKGRAHALKRHTNLKEKKGKKHPRDNEADKGTHGPDIRPFGWFSLRIGDKSRLNYEMDMITADKEYHNRLDIYILGSRMTSSVNHDLLWESAKQTISCDMSNPLQWNRRRTWNFNVNSQGLDLFLLREHIYLLTDMANDWTSGPSSDFHVFVPFQYNMSFTFDDFRLFMNLNDSNIINNPSDTDDNTFLVIKGENLQSTVGIPALKYRPNRNTIPFNVNVMDGTLELSTPLWNTQRSFMKDRSVGSLKALALKGTYTYHMATSPTLTDIVTLDIDGDLPQLHNYGFILRYFLNVKDNYFGECQHFKTLEEFQELLKAENAPKGNGGNPNRKSNDLDVILHVRGENPDVLVPANMYGNGDDLKLQASFLEADVRFTNYYMDIEVSFSPLEAALVTLEADGSRSTSPPQLFIDGLRIHGHRLFGLPPAEPTYVCNWDFEVGKVVGECSPPFLKCATSAVRFVGFSIDDEENALPPIHPTILPDVTFVRASLQSIDIWILEETSAVLFSTAGFDFDFNDWAGRKLSKHMNVCIPSLTCCVVDKNSALRLRELDQPARTQAYLQTTVKLKMIERDYDFATSRSLQQQHVRMHDNRTNRTPWLLLPQEQSGLSLEKLDGDKALPAAMPLPTMPEPTRGMEIYGSSSLTSSSWSTYGGPGLGTYYEGVNQHRSPSTRTKPFLSGEQARTYNSTPTEGPPDQWVPPSFKFYGVRPDTRLVPSFSPVGVSSGNGNYYGDELDFSDDSDSEKASQVYIHCELGQGLTGYCSPEAIFAFSTILADFQPTHPVEVIDSLQAKVISDILGHEKMLKNKPRKVLNASLRVPICRMKLINYSDTSDEVSFQDEYFVELCNVHALYRRKDETKSHTMLQNPLGTTTHITIDSASVSAQGKTADTSHFKGEFHGKLEGIVFRSVSEPTKDARLRLQHVEALTFNESIEGLALLAERANKLIRSITSSFERGSTGRTNRLHSLVYFLTKHGSQTSDPLFLTRASYVLRAAGDHLRLHDSWKIISRLRNIYNSLPKNQKAELTLGCLKNTITPPQDSRTFVLSNFDKWRTWDVSHVKKSYVMNTIWGGEGSGQSKKLDSGTNSLLFSIETCWLSVDPGPRETGFLVEDLSLRVDQKELDPDEAAFPPSAGPITSVQCSCSNISLHIKWEICRLIESVLKITSRSIPRSDEAPEVPMGKPPRKSSPNLHITFVSYRGDIELEGINLKLNMASERFKGSIVHQPSSSSAQDTWNVIVSSESSTAEFRSRSTLLMSSKLLRPNISLSHTSERKGPHVEHDWKSTAASQRLQYDMLEDPIGLLHIADQVIEDELKYVLDVGKAFGASSPKRKATPPEDRSIHHIRIFTFLKDYQLRISLLPSVFYFIKGKEVRLAVAPALERRVEINFDSKSSLHELHSDKDGAQGVISSVDIPPINGRVLIDSLHHRTALDVDLTIEPINVEASSIRNLLAAVNGPEISHFISDMTHDAQSLKEHLDQIFPPGSEPASSATDAKNVREFVYKLHLSLAGIYIHFRAPGLRNKDYSADLDFNLGMIQVGVENAPNGGTILTSPDFEVNIHEIRFGLLKRQQEDVQSCGSLVFYARVSGSSHISEGGETIRSYHLSSDGLEVELFAETASIMIDIVAHLQKRIKSLDLSQDVKHLRKLRLLRPQDKTMLPRISVGEPSEGIDHKKLFDAMYSVELTNLQLTWFTSKEDISADKDVEDLMFSVKRIDLATRRDNAARLRIEDMQLQMIPMRHDRKQRSQNSALLPEVVFNVAYLSTNEERRLAFQAAGKALDIRITSDSILPASLLQTSLAAASAKLREATALLRDNTPPPDKKKQKVSTTMKRLGSLLVDADFAGAVVSLQSRHSREAHQFVGKHTQRANLGGKYGQYIPQDVTAGATAKLQAPGVALKVQFEDTGTRDPTLNAELKVDASTNLLHPTVVPLVTQISSSIKEVVGENENVKKSTEKGKPYEKTLQGNPSGANDPTTILGRCKLNVGLRICKQEFTLSCQPIARVAATARFEDSYITINTVQSEEKRRFFAVLVAFNSLQLSIKHVYSSESTANFEIESIVMSLMNSKHVSSSAGISAILKISPTKVYGNAKQAQDFLLFREIWIPRDDSPRQPKGNSSSDTQAFVVQRYRQMASAGAFPWDSTIAVDDLSVQLDLGQTVGKSDFTIKNLWISSKKSSDWEQNLCFGFDSIAIESTGRLSGFVELSQVKLRTSIMWPDEEPAKEQTPLIQASLGFSRVQAKVSFEYQPFLFVDITSFAFLMYNVRHESQDQSDRLVSNLEGDKFQVFCTALSASQAVALYQTLQRLVEDKQAAYAASLKEVESFLRRKTSTTGGGPSSLTLGSTGKDETGDSDEQKMPISLHTDVVVTLRAINIGAFPSTFHDGQIFKLEALDAEARFTVAAAEGRIHGGLTLTLGQLRVALSGVKRPNEPDPEELSVSDVVSRATGSRGGTILKVPRVVASMETWQTPTSSDIDYIFKSLFEGRVDVGWNYSRISFIRGMWTNHSRTLANRLGKPLHQTAVKITGGPKEGEEGEYSGQEKITAVVNVPQSRYVYTALEPPVIETPQLRDMGEATPPLEWIGLNREKLPNLTHQIVMVTLMEVAKDVEDAYFKILGS